MYSKVQYEIPSWNRIYDMLLKQAQKIRADNYKPDIIVCIARGGLVPSRILVDLLNSKELEVITIEYYIDFGQTKKEPILKQCLHTKLHNKKVLLIDDVSDSGKTLQLARKHLEEQGAKEIKIATIYRKPGTRTKPDFWEKETDRWIVFPWEAKETIGKIKKKTADIQAKNKEFTKLIEAGFPKQLAQELLQEDGSSK